ncbi:hypothetical protein [Ensifer sp. MJa1]|uniref:hypothetical protein n=1 Tax=Ensifer sp. MJa1 TaxID=2919888 RepID=UPI00300BD948
MADAARAPRRPRFVCMALNAAGRPVPTFDPFLGDMAGEEEALAAMGEIEHLLFGERPGGVPGYRKGEGAA